MGMYQEFGLGGVSFGGIFRKPAEMPAPPHWLLYAKVRDCARAASAATRAGGTIVNGPMEVPGGDWVAQILDPQGAAFAVHAVKTADSVAPKPAGRAAKPAKAPKPRRHAAKKSTPARVARKAAAKKSTPRASAKRKAVAKTARKKTAKPGRASAPRKAGKRVPSRRR